MINDSLRVAIVARDHAGALDKIAVLSKDGRALREAIPMITELYQRGDDEQRRFIVGGVLEHLFESEGVEELFANWAADPELAGPFQAALEWGSSVRAKRRFLELVARACSELIPERGYSVQAVRFGELGTDSAVLALRDSSGGAFQLVLDCDSRLAESEPDERTVSLCARYAADPSHWSRDEYDATQRWVDVTKASGR